MKYIRPEMNITEFDSENVVTSSNPFDGMIGGENKSYSESVSYSELAGGGDTSGLAFK